MKKKLMRRIAAFVSIADGIRMASNYTKATCECLKYSRSGLPEKNDPSKNSRQSLSC